MDQTEPSKLILEYTEAALAYGAARERGDHSEANRQHDIVTRTHQLLRASRQGGQDLLLALLEHKSQYVRECSAAHVLEFAPEQAKPVLERLTQMGGITGFSAKMTLNEWRKGTLRPS